MKRMVDGRRDRHDDEDRDDDRAQNIDRNERIGLGITPANDAGAVGADDVEDADNGDRGGGEPSADAVLDQIGGEMDGDEGNLKAADEEADESRAHSSNDRKPW